MCGRPHFLLNRLSAHGVTWFLKVPPTVKTYSVFLKSVSGFLRATANDRIHPLEFCQRFSLTGISFVTSATALQWFCVFNFGLVWSYNYVCASHTDKLFYMLSAIPQLCLYLPHRSIILHDQLRHRVPGSRSGQKQNEAETARAMSTNKGIN